MILEILQAGFVCLLAPIDKVVGRVSLRVQEMKVSLETKTQDNVFVVVNVSIQYQAIGTRYTRRSTSYLTFILK